MQVGIIFPSKIVKKRTFGHLFFWLIENSLQA
jgi:hypothetical protein